MPNPEDVSGVRRFFGFVNYLSKFLPSLSDLCEPFRKLTLKDAVRSWHEVPDKAVAKIKQFVTCTPEPVLGYFDPNQSLILQCGASETDLGASILQIALAFASRALTDIETRYAQLENELLAVVFGLEKFHKYTYGRDVTVQIDHKHWR